MLGLNYLTDLLHLCLSISRLLNWIKPTHGNCFFFTELNGNWVFYDIELMTCD